MPRALTNGRTGGVASPSATQPIVFSNVVGSLPYPRSQFPRPYADRSLLIQPPAGAVVASVASADTALAFVAETVAVAVGRSVTPDTAATVVDGAAVTSVRAVAAADTALVVVGAPTVTAVRAVTAAGTALTVSPTVAAAVSRTTAVTALAVSETLPVVQGRPVADVALTPSSVVAPTAVRAVADTALAVSVTLGVRGPTRAPADAGLSMSSILLVALVSHPPSDPSGLVLSERVNATAVRPVADTALSLAGSPSVSLRHPAVAVSAADTALAVADVVPVTVPRSVGPGVTTTTSRATSLLLYPRSPGDRALTVGASVARVVVPTLVTSDTLPGVSGTIRVTARIGLASTALQIVEVFRPRVGITLTDGGLGAVAPRTTSTTLRTSATLTTRSGAGVAAAVDAAATRARVTSSSNALAVSDAIRETATVTVTSTALSISSSVAAVGVFVGNVRGDVSVANSTGSIVLTVGSGRVGGVSTGNSLSARALSVTVSGGGDDVSTADSGSDRLVLAGV